MANPDLKIRLPETDELPDSDGLPVDNELHTLISNLPPIPQVRFDFKYFLTKQSCDVATNPVGAKHSVVNFGTNTQYQCRMLRPYTTDIICVQINSEIWTKTCQI